MGDDRVYDLVIVGAGPFGLAMGKTYLEVNPKEDVLLLDESSTVGGTWAKDRLYEGLKTNNVEGGIEYGDWPMQGEARYGLKHDAHVPGETMNRYMQDFADHFDLNRRTRFNCKAHTVKRLDDGTWVVEANERDTEQQFHTRRLVVATGLTTQPFVPYFQGQEKFDCPISHVKNPQIHSELLSSVKSVTILNVTKSSYDVAYACATKGIQVHWVVRKSGHGPNFMAPVRVTPLLQRLENLGCVRGITLFSPCLWTGGDGGFPYFRSLLHHTRLGRMLTSALWSIIHQDVVTRARYDEHPETAKLKPRGSAVWYACTLGIFNYDEDFLSYVRNGTIKVYDDDIDHLSPNTVHLSSGTSIPCEALICSTGWDHRPSLVFEPPGLAAELGLPTQPSPSSPISPSLISRANTTILKSLPWLAQNRPVINPHYQPLTANANTAAARTTTTAINKDPTPAPDTRTEPYRLYRFLVPPTHATSPAPTIAFTGFIWAIPTILVAQTAALWITAYFAGRLPQQQQSQQSQQQDQVLWETARDTQYVQLRYPGGFGARFPDLAFDALPYVDHLVGDLGLEVRRKKGGWFWQRWWREAWEHYSVRDYRGLVGEWMQKEGLVGGGRVSVEGNGVANGRVKGD